MSSPVRFDFDQGLPDPALYPTDLLAGYLADVLRTDGEQAGRYYDGTHAIDMRYGHHGLRSTIAEWLAIHEGTHVDASGVLLANGSTNGIAMAINTFVGPGDALIVEDVSYPYAAQYGRAAGATVLTVPVGPHGMEVDQLETVMTDAIAQGLRPRMIYTIATFQAPTGTVLAVDRRRSLIDMARRFDALVLDDNCYYHLWFDTPPPTSLLALDHPVDGSGATVIQSGSFSKYIVPALRMAWLAGHPDHMAAIAAQRQDFAVSQITARVVAQFIEHGDLDRHLDLLRSAYRAKRDAGIDALAVHVGDLVQFAVPSGGLYFWLSVDPSVDFDAAMARAAERGVAFRPGVRFEHRPDGGNYLRLSVAQSPLEDIEPGIAQLGAALKESIR